VSILIRKAIATDVSQILELYEELSISNLPIDVDEAIAVLEKSEQNDITYFVAVDDGRVVATCFIAIIPAMKMQCSPIGFIENVVTAAEYRRRGIGREIMQTTIDYAKERGCFKVTLSSGAERGAAHDFYKSLGFDGESKKNFELRFKCNCNHNLQKQEKIDE